MTEKCFYCGKVLRINCICDDCDDAQWERYYEEVTGN